jgi:hypothetical protein
MRNRNKLTVGEWVEVRSKEEILRTLDKNGQLDGMPFMPEMFQFCNKRFKVHKRAHKTCDPDCRSHSLYRTVHLETRCDGSAHGECQAGCLLYWKEAWLKPIKCDTARYSKSAEDARGIPSTSGCSESDIFERARPSAADGHGLTYVCQATQVQHLGKVLKYWDIRQYVEDYLSGNVQLRQILNGFVYSMYFNLSQAGIGVGPAMRWVYNKEHRLWGGSRWPRAVGKIPEGQPTPNADLDLQPGELVRVKSHEDILRTVNTGSRTRGLWWDAELVPYCGHTFRVLKRVTRVIDEKTGKMLSMKNPCIILDSAICEARYSPCRMFCPKGTYAYWREIWLERIEQTPALVTIDSRRSTVDVGVVNVDS